MFILIIMAVSAIFFVLHKFFIEEEEKSSERKENIEIVLSLPREIVANDRPTMSLMERERRRRKLLEQVYLLGTWHANNFNTLDKKDRELASSPYYSKNKDNSYAIEYPQTKHRR